MQGEFLVLTHPAIHQTLKDAKMLPLLGLWLYPFNHRYLKENRPSEAKAGT